MEKQTETPNRLIHEKSPYLRQHAHNPVHWYPWGDEAFDKAARENKPIFLSIGYSTCHWCHVMERESFEDQEIARLLNDTYVSIKVDREERPDVDHLYMTVCTTMTGQGGWPLSLFLFPDRRPFFAGSYFPRNDRHGLPGFSTLITQLAYMWHEQRPLLEKQANIVVDFIKNSSLSDEGDSDPQRNDLSAEAFDENHNAPLVSQDSQSPRSRAHLRSAPFTRIVRDAYQALVNSYSEQYGGFGSAPKFPTPHKLSFLMRYIQLRDSQLREAQENTGTDVESGREMLTQTLEAMVCGGIYDHVGGGFCRYSTDSKWLVPHFEKMLYDNALLARVYAEAGSFFKEEDPAKAQGFCDVAHDVIQYILREMTDASGAFYTAQDADSEGVEGKYYLWTPQELIDVLGPEDAAVIARLYNVQEEGNFAGGTILNTIGHPLTEHQRHLVKPMLEKLRSVREQRIAPMRDEKILTSSNGLMIGTLSIAGRLTQENTYIRLAWQAAEFIWQTLRTPEGRLLSRHYEGESAHPACSDDYSYLMDGFLELYRATFEEIWLRRALELAHTTIELFWDHERQGLFLSAYDVHDILIRGKNFWDGALPSGNAVAAKVFLELSRLTGDSRWEDYVYGIFAAAEGEEESAFASATVALAETALWLEDGGTEIVVVEADRAQPKSVSMASELHQEFLPFTVIALCGPGHEEMSELAPFTASYESLADKTSAYVCRNQQCSRAVTDSNMLFKLL